MPEDIDDVYRQADQPNHQEPVAVTQAEIELANVILADLHQQYPDENFRPASNNLHWLPKLIARHRIAHAPSQPVEQAISDWLRSYGDVQCGEGMNITSMRSAGPSFADMIDRGAHRAFLSKSAPSQPTAGDDYEQYRPALQAMKDVFASEIVFTAVDDDNRSIRAGLAFAAAMPTQGFCPTCGKPSDSDCSKCAQWWKDTPPPSQPIQPDFQKEAEVAFAEALQWNATIDGREPAIRVVEDALLNSYLCAKDGLHLREGYPDPLKMTLAAPSQHSELADIERARECAVIALRNRNMPSPSIEANDIERGERDEHSAVQSAVLALRQTSPDTVRRDAWEQAATIADSELVDIDEAAPNDIDVVCNQTVRMIAAHIRALATKQGEPT